MMLGPTHISMLCVDTFLVLPHRRSEICIQQKTKKESPTWHMVDVKFKSRAKHFVSLHVLKGIAGGDMGVPEYLTSEDVDAIKGHFHPNSCKLMD